MKILARAFLTTLSTLTLLTAAAHAATVSVTTDNDVILGLFATSGTGAGENLEVNLGNISQFTSATAPLTLSELSATDITQNYGTTWFDNSNLTFGVIATNGRFNATSNPNGNSTIWATEPESNPPSTPYPVRSLGSNAFSISVIEPVAARLNGQTSTANSPDSALIPFSAAGDGSYWGEDTFAAGTSFRQFSPPIDQSVTNNILSLPGGLAVVSDFLQLTPGTSAAVDLGKFELLQNGTLLFVPAAVPEPSPVGLVGVGLLSLIGMVVLRRRRSIVA